MNIFHSSQNINSHFEFRFHVCINKNFKLLFLFFLCLIPAPLFYSEAVQGNVGQLQCNITPPITEDRVALVIWYKEGYTTPIYR